MIIGEECWLGTKVQIRKGSVVGGYTVSGANVVATKDLLGKAVCGGIPVKEEKIGYQ